MAADDFILGEGQDTYECLLQVFWEMEKQKRKIAAR
jgi:hypothetical protein